VVGNNAHVLVGAGARGVGGMGGWKTLSAVIEAKTLSQLAKWMSHRPRS
jgi:hypothetical protein